MLINQSKNIKMNLKLTLLALFISFFQLQAQNTGTISGKVVEKSNNSPIPYATIVLKSNDQIVNGGITDEKGEFSISKIAYGN